MRKEIQNNDDQMANLKSGINDAEDLTRQQFWDLGNDFDAFSEKRLPFGDVARLITLVVQFFQLKRMTKKNEANEEAIKAANKANKEAKKKY